MIIMQMRCHANEHEEWTLIIICTKAITPSPLKIND
jgi:hypothetical protein